MFTFSLTGKLNSLEKIHYTALKQDSKFSNDTLLFFIYCTLPDEFLPENFTLVFKFLVTNHYDEYQLTVLIRYYLSRN